jgi:hypothetical protein
MVEARHDLPPTEHPNEAEGRNECDGWCTQDMKRGFARMMPVFALLTDVRA